MPRKKVIETTAEGKLIAAKTELDELINEKGRIETAIKEKKALIIELEKEVKLGQLSELAAKAEKAGITVADLIAAFNDKNFVNSIPKAEEEKSAPAPANVSAEKKSAQLEETFELIDDE